MNGQAPTSSAAQRRDRILALAQEAGLADVAALSEQFGVTASTVRRDLARLTAEGLLARTYGGAIALASPVEPSLRHRAAEAPAAKRAIADLAATFVAPGQTVFLDAGSTVAGLARALRGAREDATVVTASLTAVLELGGSGASAGAGAGADHTRLTHHIQLTCLGGTYRPLSNAFVGPLAEAAVERMTFDTAFLSADGVVPEHGLCEADAEQVRLKEQVASRARRVYVLAHAAKLGAAPFHAWLPLRPGWTVLTDAAADPAQLDALRSRGVGVEIGAEVEAEVSRAVPRH
ncbi:DeoR/GlpR family DNA-binding transcription regulator [Streptomyces boninensis]|uniref:DeoR/GlpR family DNA-binding transcription regulator n=1 Tax=Streptomyces boninensis TaxID=2039455 RepID=UPI003B21C6CD